jgi:2-keto-4-pentenoate hydratase/2-oxohepta-3-ene-1,7-dioic acid hydratase in catechol pathway
MKITRVLTAEGTITYGSLAEDGTVQAIEGDIFGDYTVTAQTVVVQRTLAPVAPPNILCIGANYRRHIEESNVKVPTAPAIFIKPTTALCHPGDPIRLPAAAPEEVDYEAELAIVIGREARNVSQADALNYVLGYCCANDVSARDCQLRYDLQWARGKGFDTFCPLGPFVHTEVNGNALRIRSLLNGAVMQDSSTADMLFPCEEIVSYLSHQFTLLPGTVILTGTPEGVGMARKPPVYLRPGDTITIEIEHLGALSNPVAAP